MKDTSISTAHSTANQGNPALALINLKGRLEEMDARLASVQKERASKSQDISLLQNEINKISLSANDIDNTSVNFYRKIKS